MASKVFGGRAKDHNHASVVASKQGPSSVGSSCLKCANLGRWCDGSAKGCMQDFRPVKYGVAEGNV